MANIVIIGAGLGGTPLAYELRRSLGRDHRITVVNSTSYFQFVPSNPWLAVGWRTRGKITLPIGQHLARKGIDFIGNPVARIDAADNNVQLADGRSLPYDYLVIATGPKLAFDEVPGAGPADHSQSICTVDHAEQTWRSYQEFLQNPGPVVIGAMPGASCFGPAYEFAFIVNADLKRRRLRKRVPITFVTSEPYIGHLGLGGVGDSKTMLESEFRSHDIKWITNARTTRVEPGRLFATEMDASGAAAREHELPFRFSMMLPAFRGVDAVAAVEGLCNPRGFVLVDQHQRSKRHHNIYAAGVCIAIPPVEATPVPTGAPKTGYMIETMVTAIVNNIKADLAGQPATAQRQLDAQGALGTLGHDRVREVFPAQDEAWQFRTGVREIRAALPRHRQARTVVRRPAPVFWLGRGAATGPIMTVSSAGFGAAMKTTGRTREVTAATQISRRIADLADWRGATLARVRELIHSADPAVVEEWKWMGTRGASIRDPQQLFNASLEGSTRRAIDLREGETLNAGAFKRLVRAASAANVSARAQRPAGKNSVRC